MKRVKGFLISTECVADVIKKHWADMNWPMPQDVRHRGVDYDYKRDAFILWLESPEFDVVPEGAYIPIEE